MCCHVEMNRCQAGIAIMHRPDVRPCGIQHACRWFTRNPHLIAINLNHIAINANPLPRQPNPLYSAVRARLAESLASIEEAYRICRPA